MYTDPHCAHASVKTNAQKMHLSSEFTSVYPSVKCVGVAMGRTSFYSAVCEIIFLIY